MEAISTPHLNSTRMCYLDWSSHYKHMCFSLPKWITFLSRNKTCITWKRENCLHDFYYSGLWVRWPCEWQYCSSSMLSDLTLEPLPFSSSPPFSGAAWSSFGYMRRTPNSCFFFFPFSFLGPFYRNYPHILHPSWQTYRIILVISEVVF